MSEELYHKSGNTSNVTVGENSDSRQYWHSAIRAVAPPPVSSRCVADMTNFQSKESFLLTVDGEPTTILLAPDN